MPNTVLGTKDTVIKKISKVLALIIPYTLKGKTRQ